MAAAKPAGRVQAAQAGLLRFARNDGKPSSLELARRRAY
jgi:hypothetical protein